MAMDKTTYAETIHSFTIPVFIRTLENLQRIIGKAERHAKQQKIEPATLLNARLYPSMFNFLQQVQYACFLPVDFARHFSTEAAPRVGYDETNFAELKSSIKQTINYLKAIKPKQFRDKENAPLPVFFDPSLGLPAGAHAARISVPDFFFHVTTAYCILRHNGVPLSKGDFLGAHGAGPLKKTRK
jgi:uncharacterized protein